MAAGSVVQMNGLCDPFPGPASKVVFGELARGKPGLRLNAPLSLQRLILGIGFAVLAGISAASIALDVKSQSDAAWVRHTLEALNELTDIRLSFRHAESAARGYLLTDSQYFLNDYHQFLDRIVPAFAGLKKVVSDNPAQIQLLESSEPVVARRFAITNESIRLKAAGDTAGIAVLSANAEGQALAETADAQFEQLAREEGRLLTIRSAESEGTGRLLLAIDLCCAALILLLAVILIREGRRSSRQQAGLQRVTETENERLEIAVAERTEHLLAAHEKLRQAASVLNSVFAGMAEAVLVFGKDGQIILSNAAAEGMLRYSPGMTVAQLQARNIAYQSDGSTKMAAGETPTARALRGEKFDGLEVNVRRIESRDPIYLVASGRPMHDASGAVSGASLIFRDNTAARETEQKLHQSQKLDAIGKLTGGVAHDFNNMLTVIAGTTEILVADLGSRPDLQAVASLINQAADRCAELVQHLLAFARKQPLQPRKVNISETILDIAKLLRPTLGEHIEVKSILERDIPTALVDPSQLANALINLAINARDAMPDGGKLVMESAGVVLDEAFARANADIRPGAYVMIAVTDTGTGMSAQMCEKAFEPFFTTKETGRGTGLGLSMVYGFVKQSGGHIKIHSELGRGTTIRFYLPAARGEADVAVPVVAQARGVGETILVVEDDALVRDFVIAQLHSLGYRTVAAANSREALAHVKSAHPFDLLFTDVVMPGGMTGRQLADEAARRRPGTKVLYTSGYNENAIAYQGRLDGSPKLLSKPYRKSALASMIRLALGDAVAESLESASIPLADTSIVAPPRRPPAGGQALSSG
jgi:signal transduction histidine kinase/CHASE3 domain sensor protein/ActR/RegA family two-component response regulator